MDKDLIAKSDPYCIIKCGPEGFHSQNLVFATSHQHRCGLKFLKFCEMK